MSSEWELPDDFEVWYGVKLYTAEQMREAYAAGQKSGENDTKAQAHALIDAAIARGAGQRAAVPEYFADVVRCLEDVATQQRATGRGYERMTQLIARMHASRKAAAAPTDAAQERDDAAI